MKILLDTHILVWYFAADEKLSQQARKIIANDDNEVYFSALAIFEIDLKHANRPDVMPFDGNKMLEYCRQAGFKELPLTVKHTLKVKNFDAQRKHAAAPRPVRTGSCSVRRLSKACCSSPTTCELPNTLAR